MKKVIFLLLVTCLSLSNLNARILYVNSKCKGDGTSWANAAPDIMTLILCGSASFQKSACTSIIPQDTTITPAQSGDSIFVAAGTYAPLFLWNGDNSCSNNIHIFGGFEGWERSVCERKDWRSNESVITGRNMCRAVWIEGSSNVTLDGFTITDGFGEGAGLRLVNCVPKLSNLIIKNNDAKGTRGGGIFLEHCRLYDDCTGKPICTTFANVLISNNHADFGSAFYATYSIASFVNTTIANNYTEDGGCYIDLNYSSDVDFYNSILWGNQPSKICYYQSPNLANFSYCDVEDLLSVGNNVGGSSIDKDPLFIKPPFDYHVQPQSPIICAGDLQAYQNLFNQFCEVCFLWLDLDAKERFYYGKAIDMGCYQNINSSYSPIVENPQEKSQINDAIIELYSPCGIKISTCNKEDINNLKSTLNNGFYILIERSSVGEVIKADKLIINK